MDKVNKTKKFKVDNKMMTRIMCLILVGVTIFGFVATAISALIQ